MTNQGGIHEEHPFLTPVDERDPARRLRGRLVAPVTIVTAGPPDAPVGLTVSSLMVAEGDPPLVHMLIGPTTDLHDAISDTGKAVVHVLEVEHRTLADVFAGMRPAPGGMFADVSVTTTVWGPVIDAVPNRAYCALEAAHEVGYHMLVTCAIDQIEVAELDDPLAYFRGAYRRLDG